MSAYVLCERVQVIIFVAYIFVHMSQDDETPSSQLAAVPRDSPLIYQPARRYEAWRFLTYMLLHDGSVDFLTYFASSLQCFLYSVVQVVHPTGATRCTDKHEIWQVDPLCRTKFHVYSCRNFELQPVNHQNLAVCS